MADEFLIKFWEERHWDQKQSMH